MKLFLFLLLGILFFTSFSKKTKSKVITYVSYEYDSERLKSKEDLKVFQYISIQPNGYAEILNEDGKSYNLQIDKSLVKKINKISRKSLNSQIIKSEIPKGSKFAGKYSYLSVRKEEICYNPYDLSEELKTILTELDYQIKNREKKQMDHFIILTDYLKNSIKTTHKKSNLAPIANPPPMIITE